MNEVPAGKFDLSRRAGSKEAVMCGRTVLGETKT